MMTRIFSVSLACQGAFAALVGIYFAGDGSETAALVRCACLLILGCFLVLLAIYLEIASRKGK